MTSVQKVGNYNLKQKPVIVSSIPKQAEKISFKNDNDRFAQKKEAVITRPAILQQNPQQAQIARMIDMQKKLEKDQNKQKRKQNLSWILGIGASLALILALGGPMIKSLFSKEGKNLKDLTQKVREIKNLGIKREAEEELARQSYERSLYRVQDLIQLDRLANTVEKKVPADIKAVRDRLNKEVIGMDEAKQPVIDFLESVNYKIKNGINNDKPIIIALDGPPGTGKTTLMKVIADALDMHFAKISLGGTKNIEAITGFERTYAGATPGLMAKAQLEGGTKKVLYGLDEMEKASESVLNSFLSILDDQKIFKDKYYNSNIDLSQSIFVATTNELEKLKGSPIYDRLKPHVIKIKPYNLETKTKIAEQKLKAALEANLMNDKVDIANDVCERIAQKTEGVDQGGRCTTQLVDKFIIALQKKLNYHKSAEKLKIDTNFIDDIFKNIDLS